MLSILVVKRYLHQSFTTSRAFFAGLAVIHSIQPLDLSDWGPNWMFDVIQQVLDGDITYKLHVVDISILRFVRANDQEAGVDKCQWPGRQVA